MPKKKKSGNNNGNGKQKLTRNQRRRRNRNKRVAGTYGVARTGMQVAPVARGFSLQQRGSNIDTMVFTHTEMITSITGSNAYSALSLPCNPGLPSVFPWLSQLSTLWESYEVLAFELIYIPTVSTATQGSVMIGFDYDTYDDPPPDKSAFLMTQDSCQTPVWSNCSVVLKRQDLVLASRQNLYVRGNVVSGDLKTYDLGRIIWAVQGNNTTGFVGDLMISYSIRFRTPQPRISAIMDDIVAEEGNTFSQTDTAPFGTTGGINQAEYRIGIVDFVDPDSVWTCSRTGTYYFVYLVNGTGLVAANFALDVQIFNTTLYPSDELNQSFGSVNAAGTLLSYGFSGKITERNGIYLNADVANAPTVTQGRLFVFPMQPGLNV